MTRPASDQLLTVEHGNTVVEIGSEPGALPAGLRVESATPGPGLTIITVTADVEPSTSIPVIIRWRFPVANGLSYWTPDSNARRGLPADWTPPVTISPYAGAPAGIVYDVGGRTVGGWTLSEQSRSLTVRAGVEEETAYFRLELRLCATSPGSPDAQTWHADLRLDSRALPFHRTLADIGCWWRAAIGDEVLSEPDNAFDPVYSTWYSFHQDLDESLLASEAVRAAELGLQTVIVDDGWQTADNGRGYAYTGDWQVSPQRFRDLNKLVRDAKQVGVEYLLWIAPSLAGEHAAATQRFRDKVINWNETLRMFVFDIRHPDVREYLVSTCVDLVRNFGLAGLKIDFVDNWLIPDAPPPGPGADVTSLDDAVDLFLSTVAEKLQQVRPDVLVEFRQHYIGPRMWRYGNLFRAADCPLDRVANRVRTVDLRLMLADRAVHADPQMWDPAISAQAAAEQLLAALFAVPQLSMIIKDLPDEHIVMLRHWLGFIRDHRQLLYRGRLETSRPDTNYAIVRAHGDGLSIIASYEDQVVHIGDGDQPEVILVNASGSDGIVVQADEAPGFQATEFTDCFGATLPVPREPVTGLQRLAVPRSGFVRLRKTPDSTHQPFMINARRSVR